MKEIEFDQINSKKSKKFKPIIRIYGGFLCFIFLAFLSFMCFRYLQAETPGDVIFYNENSDLDYKVYLKENDFFEQEYLEKDDNQQYVANIIDNIKFEFNYLFNISQRHNYKYEYYVIAEVKATEKGNPAKVLYTKNEDIKKLVEKYETNSNGYNLNFGFDVDYVKYNAFITNFKKTYTLSIDSTLTIKIFVKNFDDVRTLNTNQIMTIEIPLSEQTVGVNIDYEEISNSNTIQEESLIEVKVGRLIFGTLSGIFAIVILIITIKLIVSENAKKTKYFKKISKILREYDRIIVSSKSLPELKDYNLVEVDSFEEMLDARETLDVNILYTELIPNEKSAFVIINNDLAYIYIIRNDEGGS